MYTEANRVQIRLYTGASATFLQLWPALENAITATQSVADGGTRPDTSTETLLLSIIADLQAIDAKIKATWCTLSAVQIDELKVDAVRGTAMLRSNGRILVTRLCRTLGMRAPLVDVFSSLEPNAAGLVVGGGEQFL